MEKARETERQTTIAQSFEFMQCTNPICPQVGVLTAPRPPSVRNC